MKIYISGPINGNQYAIWDFDEAARELRAAGHEVINPTNCEETAGCSTYKEQIDTDLELLSTCDAVFMLRGWEKSKGAKLEHA